MKRLVVFITALALVTLACGFNVNVPRLQTGPTETVTVCEKLSSDAVAEVSVKMGAGQLAIGPGAQEVFVEGAIKYNIADWKPVITNQDGKLSLEQGKTDGINGIPTNDVVNDWDLKFGEAPMNLTINAGAYDGTLDLSGLALQNLTISDGASSASVKFDSVNPQTMKDLRYTTGASNVKLTGLANANFERMTFKGGVGDYTLDFTGELQRDATVDITSGVSSLRIVIPSGMNAEVKMSGGVTDVNAQGTWTVNGKNYSTSGSGPTLTINIDMGVGSLKLVHE